MHCESLHGPALSSELIISSYVVLILMSVLISIGWLITIKEKQTKLWFASKLTIIQIFLIIRCGLFGKIPGNTHELTPSLGHLRPGLHERDVQCRQNQQGAGTNIAYFEREQEHPISAPREGWRVFTTGRNFQFLAFHDVLCLKSAPPGSGGGKKEQHRTRVIYLHLKLRNRLYEWEKNTFLNNINNTNLSNTRLLGYENDWCNDIQIFCLIRTRLTRCIMRKLAVIGPCDPAPMRSNS